MNCYSCNIPLIKYYQQENSYSIIFQQYSTECDCLYQSFTFDNDHICLYEYEVLHNNFVYCIRGNSSANKTRLTFKSDVLLTTTFIAPKTSKQDLLRLFHKLFKLSNFQ